MAPQTRRMPFPKVVIERDSDSNQSTSDDDDDGEEAECSLSESETEFEDAAENGKTDEIEIGDMGMMKKGKELFSKKKGDVPLTIRLQKVCKVCKKPGHEAGFKGATYVDCPMKPCFLCKMPGHTTMTCPHRVASEHGVIPAPMKNTQNYLEYVFLRQIRPNIHPIKPAYVIPDQVCCAVIRYHSRRVTCLEFHPTKNNILLSGDKKGQIGVWDFDKVHEKMVYGNIHSCIVNNMRFNPLNDGTIYAASADGTISFTDLETGISSSLMNVNPDGWQGPSTWRMLYGMDVNSEKGVVLFADNFGFLYMLDMRSNNKTGEALLIHKRGSKVVGLHCNPVQPQLLLSCGNDHFIYSGYFLSNRLSSFEVDRLEARIWDMRKLEAGSSLYDLPHKRVVNSAYFSPLSGRKILTTCQDNRLRIWDSIFGNLESPSREIVHSHDFNRHLTPFRAEWDPKDPAESLAVIGRYISENYNGTALHPIDFIDITNGQLVAEVMDPNITTISPVNKLHPRDDVLATGSSRSLFIWRPKERSEPLEQKDDRKIVICQIPGKKSKQKFGGESDDDSDDYGFASKGKNIKLEKRKAKSTPGPRKGKR